jgi:hypothetical protein
MLRSLRAIVWLRWRLLINSVRGGKRRDRMEQISRVFALAMPFVIAAMLTGSVLATGIVGFLGGRAVAAGGAPAPVVVLVLRGVLLLILIVTIILASGSPSQTALGKYTRLLLLPIPRPVLHLVEVVAHLADPWIVIVASGLVAFAAGLATGGRAGAALLTIVATVVVLALLAAVGSCLSFLVGWLFRSRRRGEIFTLVFVLLLTLVSFVPMYLSDKLTSGRREARAAGQPRPPQTVEGFNASLPVWVRVLPSEQYGSTVSAALEGRTGAATLALAVLFGQAALLFAASAAAHARMITALEGDRRHRKMGDVPAVGFRLPFVTPAVSAVTWAQFKTASRSVRGRLGILLPGPMLATLTAVLSRIPEEGQWAVTAAANGYLVLAGGAVFSLYSLLAFVMNLFGSDRAGLTLQFLAPISARELAWGKLLGCGLVFSTAIALCLVAGLIVAPNGSPFYWIAAILGAIATFFLLGPVAVWLSALFPLASDLSKTGSGGNAHTVPTLAGTFLVLLIAAPAVAIGIAARFWFEQPALALVGMTAWLIFAIAISIPLVNLAARAIPMRKENLALTAQGR